MALLVVFWTGVAEAALIEYRLTAPTDAAIGSLAAGTELTITFAFDDTQVDLAPGVDFVGAYQLLFLSFSHGGETTTLSDPIAGSASLRINNASEPGEFDSLNLDGILGFNLASSSGTLGGITARYLWIDLGDSTNSVFSRDALPGATLSASQFTDLYGTFDGGDPRRTGFSSFRSFSGSVIPEPSTAVLLGDGLIALSAGRADRRAR